MVESAPTLTIALIVAAIVVTMGYAAMGDTGRSRRPARRRAAIALRVIGRAIASQLEALRADYRRLVAAGEARSGKRSVVDRVKDYGL